MADVNIPLGEVFTSPLLAGTEGLPCVGNGMWRITSLRICGSGFYGGPGDWTFPANFGPIQGLDGSREGSW